MIMMLGIVILQLKLANQFADEIALIRRDFTFNAFAWRFAHNLSAPALVDPFRGVDDWNNLL